MIKYRMRCGQGHVADIWFRDSAACDQQMAAGHVACPECGDARMEKSLMAPSVTTSEAKAERAASPAPATPAASAPAPAAPPQAVMTAQAMRREIEGRLRALRAHIEATSENVGSDFPAEARAIHVGEAEQRAIYGQCTPDEAEELAEEGVPVVAVPWVDSRDD